MFMTPEQSALYRQFVATYPQIALRLEPSRAGIDEVNGKRVLCLETKLGFFHFHPEGLTDLEMEAVTRSHGMDGLTTLDKETGGWETTRLKEERHG